MGYVFINRVFHLVMVSRAGAIEYQSPVLLWGLEASLTIDRNLMHSGSCLIDQSMSTHAENLCPNSFVF